MNQGRDKDNRENSERQARAMLTRVASEPDHRENLDFSTCDECGRRFGGSGHLCPKCKKKDQT